MEMESRYSFRARDIRSCSIFSGSEFFVKPNLLETLFTCVATAMLSITPNALANTIFAVFLPTQGKVTSSAMVSGTLPL